MSLKRVLLITVILTIFLSMTSSLMAQDFNGWKASKYLDKIAGNPSVGLKTDSTTAEIVGGIVKKVVAVLGIIFLILILYASYNWMTAGGNSEDVRKSLAIIKWSIVGAIVVFGAYVISNYVVSNVKKASQTPSIPNDYNYSNSTDDDEMTDYVDCSPANCTLCGSDATCCSSYPNSNCCVYVSGRCRDKSELSPY